MAKGYISTLELLGVDTSNIVCLDFYSEGSTNESDVKRLFDDLDANNQMIVFTDIMYGSVNQLFIRYKNQYIQKNVSIITGVNLPIVIEIATKQDDLTIEQINEMVEVCRMQLKLMDDSCLNPCTSDDDLFEN